MGLISRVSSRTYRTFKTQEKINTINKIMPEIDDNNLDSLEMAREFNDIATLMETIDKTLTSYESKVKNFDKKVKEMVKEAIQEDDKLYEIVPDGDVSKSSETPSNQAKSS